MGYRSFAGATTAGVLAVSALFAPPAVSAPADESSVCDRFGEGEQAGRVTDLAIDEASGIVASRVHRDVLWVHNDSGGEPEIYALAPTGEMLGTYRLDGAENVDWEDIGIGRGPRRGVSYLYVGDIGSNFRERDHVTVYRVPEPATAPDGSGGTLDDVEAIHLSYPGGIVDAEALFIDPRSGDLYILTKERGFSRVLRAAAKTLHPGPVIATAEVATFDVGPDYDLDPAEGQIVPPSPLPGSLITAADISRDGSTILARTYHEILAFSRPSKGTLAEAFDEPPCSAPQRDEIQGETVGFAADGSAYFTISEGLAAAVHRFPVTPALSADR